MESAIPSATSTQSSARLTHWLYGHTSKHDCARQNDCVITRKERDQIPSFLQELCGFWNWASREHFTANPPMASSLAACSPHHSHSSSVYWSSYKFPPQGLTVPQHWELLDPHDLWRLITHNDLPHHYLTCRENSNFILPLLPSPKKMKEQPYTYHHPNASCEQSELLKYWDAKGP